MAKLRRKVEKERVVRKPRRSRSARFRDEMSQMQHKYNVKQKNRAANRVARKSRRVNRKRR